MACDAILSKNAMHRLKRNEELPMKKTSDVFQYNGVDAKEMAKQAAKSTVSTVQNTVQSGLAKAQDAVLVGLGATQELLKDRQKRSAKNLKKAQKKIRKNLKNVQGTVRTGVSNTQDVLLSGFGVAQDVLEQNTKRASKSLKKAQMNLKDTRASLQSQLERRARRRKRTRTMFRMGLLTGFVLVLFYAPWPGSETRSQLAAFWQGLFPRQHQ
jgi:nucleoid DNA-binding protein